MVTVKGGSKSQKKHIESLVEFCIQKMMPRMTELDIHVQLRKFKKEEDAYGFCLASCEDGERADRPRTFELEIDSNMRLRPLLETVAHEMVHVKQYARGELYQGSRINKHRWKGKWINKDPDYWDCPWEIEAMGREIGLFIQWAQKQGFIKQPWVKDKLKK